MTEAAMEHLPPFVGQWRVEAFGGAGRSLFEWPLDGRFLLQLTEVDHPDAPKDFDLTYTRIG